MHGQPSSHDDRPAAFGPDHPVVRWVRREVLSLLIEQWRPTRVIVFDPPDRPASLGDAPVGLLIVSPCFRDVPVAERVQRVRRSLADAAPVRPLCLTPEELDVSARVPGPVLAAARTGIDLL